MQAENPLVSIIIPTYNRAHLIGETLDSVLAQTYTNWECIIVDDGSTDNTDDVVGAYVAKDPRFKYYHRPTEHLSGGNGARNYGFKVSNGEFINFLDSDDLIIKEKLQMQLSLIISKKSNLALCQWKFFNDVSSLRIEKVISYNNFDSGISLLNYLGDNSIYVPLHIYLISRNLINKAGNWNEKLTINQDGEFFVRILLIANHIVYVKMVLGLYRRNSGINKSNYKNAQLGDLLKSWKLIEKHCSTVEMSNIYVMSAKRRIFNNLMHSNRWFVLKNLNFFSEIIFEKLLGYFSLKII